MRKSIFLTVLLGLLLAAGAPLSMSTAFALEPGDTLWTRTYGGVDDDIGYSVQQTSDGGYFVAGYTGVYPQYDFYLVKTDPDGDTLWTRTYGGSGYDKAHCGVQTSDGGYMVAGGTQSFGAGDWDVYLVKTDGNGDSLWTRTYGGDRWDWARSIQQTSDGGYIIAGLTQSFGAGWNDVWILKTDANGDTLWTRTCGGSDQDYGAFVLQTTDGGYIVAGYTISLEQAVGMSIWLRLMPTALSCGHAPTAGPATIMPIACNRPPMGGISSPVSPHPSAPATGMSTL